MENQFPSLLQPINYVETEIPNFHFLHKESTSTGSPLHLHFVLVLLSALLDIWVGMALYFSSACFSGLSLRKPQAAPVRAMASESSVAVRNEEEEKVKLGGSELKVTRLGIGAWSWGDTSYWNNFEWDGELLQLWYCEKKFELFYFQYLILWKNEDSFGVWTLICLN